MPSLNSVVLVGRLVAQPERLTSASDFRITFPLATERDETTDGVAKSVTDVHRIVVGGEQAERLLGDLRVGDTLRVEGELMNRGIIYRKERRFITEIHAALVSRVESSPS